MSNSRVRGLLAFAVVVGLVSLPGCSKSAITITLTATPSGGTAVTCTTGSTSACSVTVNQGQTVALAATVANDKTNAGVNWSVGTSVGSLSSQTTTSATYVAPSALTSSTTATVTATSIANSGVTETVSVTVNSVFQFETSSLPVATQDVAYSATISTIGATGPFSWIVLSGSLPAGLQLSNSNTASVNITGTPTAVGSSTVTIQATDSAGTPIQRTFTLTVNPPPALTIISPANITTGIVGQPYSYTLQADFGTPPYGWSLTGSGSLPNGIQLMNGVLTGTPTTPGTSTFGVKVQDSASPNPGTATKNLTLTINQVSANQDLTGNYAFLVSGFDSSGKRFVAAGSFQASTCAISTGTLDTNDGGVVPPTQTGLSGTCTINATGLGTLNFGGLTFYMSFVPSSAGSSISSANLIEFDNVSHQASGVLLQQNTGAFAVPSGNYAFGFLGADASSHRYALAGSFATGAGGVLDSNDSGTLQTNQPFTSALNAPDTTTGRGTLAFSVLGTATNYAYYVVDASRLLVMETDAGTAPVVAGTILQQSGSLGASSFTASVFETTASSSGTALTQLGVMTTDGASALSSSFDKSTGGATQSSAGTYAVATNGRTTMTGSGVAASDPVIYLTQANQGFFVGTDAAVTFGFMKAQTPGSTVSGTYAGGSIPPVLSGPNGGVKATVANAGAITFTYDASTSGGLLQDQSLSTSYSAPTGNGRGTITSMPPASTQAIYYTVSPTEFWTLTPSANGPIEIFQAPGAAGLFQQ